MPTSSGRPSGRACAGLAFLPGYLMREAVEKGHFHLFCRAHTGVVTERSRGQQTIQHFNERFHECCTATSHISLLKGGSRGLFKTYRNTNRKTNQRGRKVRMVGGIFYCLKWSLDCTNKPEEIGNSQPARRQRKVPPDLGNGRGEGSSEWKIRLRVKKTKQLPWAS